MMIVARFLDDDDNSTTDTKDLRLSVPFDDVTTLSFLAQVFGPQVLPTGIVAGYDFESNLDRLGDLISAYTEGEKIVHESVTPNVQRRIMTERRVREARIRAKDEAALSVIREKVRNTNWQVRLKPALLQEQRLNPSLKAREAFGVLFGKFFVACLKRQHGGINADASDDTTLSGTSVKKTIGGLRYG